MQEMVGQKSHKEVEWRGRLARVVASGQQVKACCRDEHVSAATFYRLRRQLEESVGDIATASGCWRRPKIDPAVAVVPTEN